jgi:hypothetical protein
MRRIQLLDDRAPSTVSIDNTPTLEEMDMGRCSSIRLHDVRRVKRLVFVSGSPKNPRSGTYTSLVHLFPITTIECSF